MIGQLPAIALTAVGIMIVFAAVYFVSGRNSLDGIESKPVGDGQHGTARWATKKEIAESYVRVPFTPDLRRKGKQLPTAHQGLVIGCEGKKNHVTALVEEGDVHAMVTAASGAGKTAYFLYPNIEYACASGMSFLCTDTKGDLFRNYAGIAKECYGYQIAVLDLRNPTRSDGSNLLNLVNKYMDRWKEHPEDPLGSDDGAAPDDAGRVEGHAKGAVHRDENRRPPHEGDAAAVFGLGHYLWEAL